MIELMRKEEYSEAEVSQAAREFIRIQPYLGLLRHVLKTYAKQTGEGYSFGGEEINHSKSGALHVYCQRTEIKGVPNRKRVAEFLLDWWERQDAEGRGDDLKDHDLTFLLGRYRTPWMMSGLRKREFWDELQAYLDSKPDGYVEEVGKAELKVRTRAPNAGVVVLPVSMDGTAGSVEDEEYDDEGDSE